MSNLFDIGREFGITNPKDRNENLRLRIQMLKLAEEEKEFRDYVKTIALRDFNFLFNLFFWTYDVKDHSKTGEINVPFITWDFQDEFIDWVVTESIDGKQDAHVDKSRDMGASWLLIGIYTGYWLRPSPGNEFLIGSRKDEYVDRRADLNTLMEKVRYLLKYLPWWMLPTGYDPKEHDNLKRLINPESGCVIKGEANNKNFGTSGRFKSMLYDEFSKWEETDHDAWTSGMGCTDSRIALSTVFGSRLRKFHQLKKDVNILHYSIHWTRHPAKDERWYEREKLRCSPLELAQEVDISYEGAAGKPFVPNYNPRIHRVKHNPAPFLDVVRLWDFGYHSPVCLMTQILPSGTWRWTKVIKGKDVLAVDFARYVIEQANLWFPDASTFIDWGDPAGDYISDKSPLTTVGMIREATGLNIRVKHPTKGVPINSHKFQTASKLQMMFGEMVGNEPRILINEEPSDEGTALPIFIETQSMWHAHEALIGGLHYPMEEKGHHDFYEKDGLFDHLGDVARYGIFVYFFSASGGTLMDQQKLEAKLAQRGKDVKEKRRELGSRTINPRRANHPTQRTKALGRFR